MASGGGTHERGPALPGASMEVGPQSHEEEREIGVAFLTHLMESCMSSLRWWETAVTSSIVQ